MRTIEILLDQDAECPDGWDDQWKLYSFCTRHAHYANPGGLLQDDFGNTPIGLRRKLTVGTAFFLSYFEHGRCRWGLAGSMDGMPDFQWDGVGVAGLLVWEHPVSHLGPKTRKDREADAECFLSAFTAWANGDVYGYVVRDDDGEELDSCFGFYGDDIRRAVADAEQDFGPLEPTGDLAVAIL